MSEVFVLTDARLACPRGVIGSTMGAYPRGTGSNPAEGNGHFFPSCRQLYLSSFSDTHARTYTQSHFYQPLSHAVERKSVIESTPCCLRATFEKGLDSFWQTDDGNINWWRQYTSLPGQRQGNHDYKPLDTTTKHFVGYFHFLINGTEQNTKLTSTHHSQAIISII